MAAIHFSTIPTSHSLLHCAPNEAAKVALPFRVVDVGAKASEGLV